MNRIYATICFDVGLTRGPVLFRSGHRFHRWILFVDLFPTKSATCTRCCGIIFDKLDWSIESGCCQKVLMHRCKRFLPRWWRFIDVLGSDEKNPLRFVNLVVICHRRITKMDLLFVLFIHIFTNLRLMALEKILRGIDHWRVLVTFFG